MNTQDFAQVIEGMAAGFGRGLKERDRNELLKTAALFRRFRDQSLANFVEFVEEILRKERGSVTALTDRIRNVGKDAEDSSEAILKDVQRLPAGDLTELLRAIGEDASGNKQQKLDRLRTVVGGNHPPRANGTPQANGQLNDEIQHTYQEYQSIERALDRLSYEEIRARFAPIAQKPKRVLEGVLQRVGYNALGSKEELAERLLSGLEMIKRIKVQTDRI